MKKIFTIVAAVLASVSLWADDATFTMTSIFDGTNQSAELTEPVAATVSTTASKSNAASGKLGTDGNYFQIVLSDATFSAVSINGYINTTSTDKNWGFQFSTDGGANWAEEVAQANDGDKTAHDVAVTVAIPDGANGFRVIRRAGTSTLVNSITLTLGAAVAPSEDPVASIAVAGVTEAYVGQTVKLTATAAGATTFWWTDQYGQTLDNDAVFEFTPDAEGTYTYTAWAENQYNTQPVTASHTVVVTERPAAVACAALYTATEGEEAAQGAAVALTSESFGGSIIFADAKDDNYAASFIYTPYGLQMCKGGKDSVRVVLDNEMEVGTLIQIKIYQSTIDTKTRGFKLQNLAKSTKLDASWVPTDEDNERTFDYEVVENDGFAGANAFIIARNNSAVLESVIVSGCGSEVETAIDNTVVTEKVVKMIENGQLFILKNGVKYNAQGAVVK